MIFFALVSHDCKVSRSELFITWDVVTFNGSREAYYFCCLRSFTTAIWNPTRLNLLYKLFGWHLLHLRVSRLSGDCSAFKKSCSQLSLHQIYFCGTSSDLQQTKQHNWINKSWVWFFCDGDLSNKNGETGQFDHVYPFWCTYSTSPSISRQPRTIYSQSFDTFSK